MNCILRGVRVIDPLAHLDAVGQDVWLSNGRIIAMYKHIDPGTLPVVDLTPPQGGTPCVLSPGFIDLHCHVREPHDGVSPETSKSAADAAAAGGFTHLVTMANTTPARDTPEAVAAARAVSTSVRMLPAAAVSRGLAGGRLTDFAGCAAAGAAAFSDDGRNALPPALLERALNAAARVERPLLLHPEDEAVIAAANGGNPKSIGRCPERPPAAELRAVQAALDTVLRSRGGQLHLQHLSTAGAVDMVRAFGRPERVSCEVTPHHLAMWQPMEQPPEPASLAKVNPPLRSESDRLALIQALRDGTIDCVATDHAPHSPVDKGADYAAAAPGFIGLETALAVCLTLGGMGGDWMPVLVERLTSGPHRVLGPSSGVREPRLRIGETATCVLFDPAQEWTVSDETLISTARNTPLMGQTLRGRVLLTLVDGVVVHHDRERLPLQFATVPADD